MYRKQDLQYLQGIFERPSNDIAVLYGRQSSGLFHLLSDFIRDKQHLYYRAVAVGDNTQRRLFAGELHDQTRTPIFPNDDYDKLISTYISENTDRKKVIVFDDFRYLLKDNRTFINFLAQLLFHQTEPGSCMILLASDDIRWVENDMIRIIGRKSSEISGIIKLNGYTATEFSQSIPEIPLAELMGIYSVAGGRCSLYDTISKDTTTRSFIMDILRKMADDDWNCDHFIPKDIREAGVYNTILMAIAQGSGKLNDLHNATAIDRAKLSVYLKTLIEYALVSKLTSSDVGEGANTVKGTYMIDDRLALFYYRFVYPHLSSLRLMGSDRFYRRYIENDIQQFVGEYYPHFCLEHVRWLRDNNLLNFKVSSIEEYHDKNNAIDFVVIAAGGSVIACKCRYQGPHMSYQAYEDVRATVRRNKINCDNIWLFSASGFDQKLSMFGNVTPGVRLIDGTDQRLR